jgi:hypothetical protein
MGRRPHQSDGPAHRVPVITSRWWASTKDCGATSTPSARRSPGLDSTMTFPGSGLVCVRHFNQDGALGKRQAPQPDWMP